MAPEVLKKEAYGFSADVFSLGICLGEMILGRYPYDDVSININNNNDAPTPPVASPAAASPSPPAEVKESTGRDSTNFSEAIISGMRPKLPTDIPVVLRDLIVSCWNADPNARPSVDAVSLALEQMEKSLIINIPITPSNTNITTTTNNNINNNNNNNNVNSNATAASAAAGITIDQTIPDINRKQAGEADRMQKLLTAARQRIEQYETLLKSKGIPLPPPLTNINDDSTSPRLPGNEQEKR